MKTYSSYSASGIPWFTHVPSHWEITKAKRLLRKMERPPRTDDKVVTCFRDGQVTLRENRRTEGFTESLQEIGYQGVRRGDLVVHGMDAFAGAAGVSDSDGKATPVYSVCTMHPGANAHYYAHIIREMARSQWVAALATGIRERSTDFRYATLAEQSLPAPPFEEQAAIVRYLDHADELINRYISAKERLITLLEEQRQASIHQAATRGLNLDTPLKPSGVAWLGQIPNHWQVRRLRSLANISTGGRDTINSLEDGAYPFFVRSQTVERIDTWAYDGEAVLTAGDGVGVGRVFHYINGKFDYHQRVYKFSDFTDISARLFYHYFSATLRFQTSQGTAKSTVDSLRLPMLQNFPVVVPPADEQDALTKAIDRVVTDTERAVGQASNQIDLMNEYRTRLIADVVTGRIDVRTDTTTLPD